MCFECASSQLILHKNSKNRAKSNSPAQLLDEAETPKSVTQAQPRHPLLQRQMCNSSLLQFGWIHESIHQLIVRKYGDEAWTKICKLAKFEVGTESTINHYYDDEETNRLVSAVSSTIGVPLEDVWEAYGGFLFTFTYENGWDELLKVLGSNLRDFLENMDALHYFIDTVVFEGGKIQGPSFRCEYDQTDDSLMLHYYSSRSSLYPIVRGNIREAARILFGMEISMKVVERKMEQIVDPSHPTGGRMEEHVVFKITEMMMGGDGDPANNQRSVMLSSISCVSDAQLYENTDLAISIADFGNLHPYHICFDRDMVIRHAGRVVVRSNPLIVFNVTKLTEVCSIKKPKIPLIFTNMLHFINSVFELRLHVNCGKGHSVPGIPEESSDIDMKGAIVRLADENTLLYMGSPHINNVKDLIKNKMYLADIPLHDASRDIILLNQSRMSQVELNARLETTTKELQGMREDLEVEKKLTDDLLSELLPATVSAALRSGKAVDACEYEEATVLFSDVVTFTVICSKCTPIQVVQLLNDLYMRFDRVTTLNGIYKVETIGDAYMVVGGVPEHKADHAELVANQAIGMIWEARAVSSPVTGKPLQIRCGIHTGAVVAGVVGQKMPRYCLFGDTVNTASRMESHGVPGRIHVSDISHRAIMATGHFLFEERGVTFIKGKGDMMTYFLVKNKHRSLWELVEREKGANNTIDGYEEFFQSWQTDSSKDVDSTTGRVQNGVKRDVPDVVEPGDSVSQAGTCAVRSSRSNAWKWRAISRSTGAVMSRTCTLM